MTVNFHLSLGKLSLNADLLDGLILLNGPSSETYEARNEGCWSVSNFYFINLSVHSTTVPSAYDSNELEFTQKKRFFSLHP